ncbi:hypothetical protein TRICHSKD4_2997 [Roseibium sp. TrichSKD4]|nr:hypothetical protein TRICHSKD4_2997 [Roseibium sp. TrichSKD4]
MIRSAVRGVIARWIDHLTITHEGRPKGPRPSNSRPTDGPVRRIARFQSVFSEKFPEIC